MPRRCKDHRQASLIDHLYPAEKTMTITTTLAKHYDDEFYRTQVSDSLDSARLYLGHFWTILQPASVVDVGCGRGAWLKAAGELGARRLIGLDGPWNRAVQMIDPAIAFQQIDLNSSFVLPQRCDLAISVEVAEHLEPARSAAFVHSLTECADVVLFSAAITGQGGENHINERPHSFWAELFAQEGFAAYDFFRPAFWEDRRVCVWYRQNLFLYVRRASAAQQVLTRNGFAEIATLPLMNCVHPEILISKTRLSFRHHVGELGPSLLRALRRRWSQPRAMP